MTWNLAPGVSKQSTMEAATSLRCALKALDLQSITVLDNGCLCCSLRDDLVGAIRHSRHPTSFSGLMNSIELNMFSFK